MKKMYFANDVLFYFANPVGYRAEDGDENEVTVDAMFVRDELLNYLTEEGLTVVVRDGVYDELSDKINDGLDGTSRPSGCAPDRISDFFSTRSDECLSGADDADDSLLPSTSADKAAGIGQEINSQGQTLRIYRLKPECPPTIRFIGLSERQKGGYGPPERREYELRYESKIRDLDLEEVWDTFSQKGFGELFLSISDVIEFAGAGVSRFFYVDKTSFKVIDFN